MDYEELSYEECFNKIFNEININKKSINKLNNIVTNQRKEIEELKNEIEDLKKYNKLKNMIEIDLKKEIEKIKIKEIETNERNKIVEEENNKINNEIIVLKETIKNIQEKEIDYIYDYISNFNIEVKENIEKQIDYIYDKIANLNIEFKENIIETDIKKEIEKIKIKEIETNERNKIFQEETNKNISNFNIHLKENIEKYNKLRNKIVKENIEKNNEIIVLKETIKNIQEKEIDYIYDNIANLNVEVEENIKINNNINNEIFELKEIKNNLQFSYVISSYNYHICYLKDIVKLEIDLFTKLINNNILPINFITPQGPNNIQCAVKYAIDNFTDKYELNKYLNDNDIIDNKYNFNLTEYISINNIKLKDLGKLNPHKKNTNNKYALQFFQGGHSYKASEINIQHKIISKNNFYKTLYNEKNELIIENNDFIKMIEMKEDIEEMEEMILYSLDRYEFMKTLKTNTIYLNDK